MKSTILYYSTNKKSEPVSFKQALLKGLAPDKGLFLPDALPVIPERTIQSFSGKPYYEIAYEVIREFLKDEIPEKVLWEMVKEAYNYDVPIENVYERKYILRLDRGPTASFKDFAARMMGRMMHYFLKEENRKMLILTATSGDTGSAIANAFHKLDNIHVVVLFPEKEITERQRKQMTTLGENVCIIALDGKFDDCQALVKEAFMDKELTHLNLSSANSINIGRLIPQIVYYFYSYTQLARKKDERIIFSVPSGNFGDMMGGVIAMNMGLPVQKFIIATNENDEFPSYLNSGIYSKIVPSLNCISSAMNVGHPSNLARLVCLYGGMMDEQEKILQDADMEKMRRDIWSTGVSDDATRSAISAAWEKFGILLEPHGAVGWEGLMRYLAIHPDEDHPETLAVSLETAHPAKFPEEINSILHFDPDLPNSLKGLEDKSENFHKMKNDYVSFKNFLKSNY